MKKPRFDEKVHRSNETIDNYNDKIAVLTVNHSTDRRIWDKRHSCPYCQKQFAKLPRHLEQVHCDELDVAKALIYPKGSKERKGCMEILRNKGNFKHNYDVLSTGSGKLIPYRRPSHDSSASTDYKPCPICLGFFKKKDLWKHVKVCRTKHNIAQKKSVPHSIQKESSSLLPVPSSTSDTFKAVVLDHMAQDKTSIRARRDVLIIEHGRRLLSRLGQEQHHLQYVRQKIRELARFVETAEQIDKKIHCLADCINPGKFKVVVEAVKTVAGNDDLKGEYLSPSLALKLGTSLKACALIVKSEAMQADDTATEAKAQKFHELCAMEWNDQVSAQALKNLHTRKFNKPKRIPLADDIRKVVMHLDNEAEKNIAVLQSSPNEDSWRNLSEITLAQLTMFNRRRGGEMERAKLENFTNSLSNEQEELVNEEVNNSLTKLEQKLVNEMSRMEILGKRGRKVTVLFTKQHMHQVKLLVKMRTVGKVKDENPFLFPRPGDAKTPLRSCDLIKKFALEAGAKVPTNMTPTCPPRTHGRFLC